MATYNDALAASLEYFEGDTLCSDVFASKYALTDQNGDLKELTPRDMHRRMAKEFARIESKYSNPMSEDEIFDLFDKFKYVIPQGSPMSGIGNPHQLQSLSNCFVIESPHDSYGGLMMTDQQQVQIMKRRGGVGFDISTIRPKGMVTLNAARTTDGIIPFMERFSNSTREVAQGGRRGALLQSISCHYPQIFDFIRVKRDKKKVTGANISIRLTDEFMTAVENNTDVQLRWPVDSKNPIVSKYVNAREIWNEIIESAWFCAEPGLLFWDNVLKFTPADIYGDSGFRSTSTNPCGELILPPYDSCRLMVVNLLSFVVNPYTKDARFDYLKYSEVVQKAQRLMDDLVDLEIEMVDKIIEKIDSDPEPEDVKSVEKNLWIKIRDRAVIGRRTGLGVTAIGDAIAALGFRYGSDESVNLVEEMYRNLAVNAYTSSCILAKERGAFPIFSIEKESGHPFIERILGENRSLRELYHQYGRRNIALTTTAPAGSVSILTSTTSGIEPVFMLQMTRRRKITEGENSSVDFTDEMGDKWTEYTVNHPGLKKWMDVTGKTDIKESPYWNATAESIDWLQRVKIQAAAQKWICHSISSTLNLPNSATQDDVKKIYEAGWKMGLKGLTVYRDGCRTGVLVSTSESSESKKETVLNTARPTTFKSCQAPLRPKEMLADIHHTVVNGESWTLLVGLMDGKPYEIMGGLSSQFSIPKKYQQGTIVKHQRKSRHSVYELRAGTGDDLLVVSDIIKAFDNCDQASLTRIISLALRHGTDCKYIVEQLLKDSDKELNLFSFSKSVSRILKKYIKDGDKMSGSAPCEICGVIGTMVYQEGCSRCSQCGASKCN